MPTTPKQIEAKIKNANTLYKRSTPAQRRVLIAKDGLKQIAARKMTAHCGIWTDVTVGGNSIDAVSSPLQPILNYPTTQCHCCGVGAIFLGYVRLNNNARVNDGWYYEDMQRITGWPKANLRLIEIAFELGQGRHENYRYNSFNNADYEAVAFGKRFEEDNDRLIAILANIVKNNGTFKP